MGTNHSSEAIALAGEDVCMSVQLQIQVMCLFVYTNMHYLFRVFVCGCIDGYVLRVPLPVWWWNLPTRIRSAPFAACSRWLVRWASSILWPCSLEPMEPTLRQDAKRFFVCLFLIYSYFFKEPQGCNGVKFNTWFLCSSLVFLYLSNNTAPPLVQVQQQAALMASVGQGGYLSPMAAFAAAQMQHMATINGLPGAPLTPTSGNNGGRPMIEGPHWFLGYFHARDIASIALQNKW